MFLGHFGLALGAKPQQPRVSLGTFFLATQLADLVWPTLLLLGVERVNIVPHATATNPFEFVHYLFTHSLLGELLAGLLLGLLYWLVKRNANGALLAGLLVLPRIGWARVGQTHGPGHHWLAGEGGKGGQINRQLRVQHVLRLDDGGAG